MNETVDTGTEQLQESDAQVKRSTCQWQECSLKQLCPADVNSGLCCFLAWFHLVVIKLCTIPNSVKLSCLLEHCNGEAISNSCWHSCRNSKRLWRRIGQRSKQKISYTILLTMNYTHFVYLMAVIPDDRCSS